MIVPINHQRHQRRESARIDNLDIVEEPIEGGLVRRTGIDCDFYATGLPSGIVVNVEVARLVEAVEERPRAGGGEVGVEVCVPR